MDFAALNVERIRQQLDAARVALELRARRHVAVMAVGLTLGGGAAFAGIARQVPAEASLVAAAWAGALVVSQIRVLGRLLEEWWASSMDADEGMETLMLREENSNARATGTDAERAREGRDPGGHRPIP